MAHGARSEELFAHRGRQVHEAAAIRRVVIKSRPGRPLRTKDSSTIPLHPVEFLHRVMRAPQHCAQQRSASGERVLRWLRLTLA
eukprot:COSAG04_NODE_21157_length_379_cov_0.557143_1_plen_83_part_01